jgi:cytochrome c oxidase subunit 3
VRERRVLDVSGLPTVVFGPPNVVWLGTILFMLIEGSMVAMLAASYFFLRTRSSDWPPSLPPPDARLAIANAVLLLVSVVPAAWIKCRARAADLRGCRIGLIILTLFALASLVLRIFEFPLLNCKWSDNAYASTVWSLLGVHTVHLATEFVETAVFAVFAFTDHVDGTRFADFDENSDYWYFVVGVAIVAYLVIHVATRLL